MHYRLMAATLPLAFTTLAALAAEPAKAQERSDWNIVLGGGGIYQPDFEGSDSHGLEPFPYVSIDYKDIAYVQGDELGVRLINFDLADGASLKMGPMARYRRDRPQKRNEDLQGLGDVDTAIEVGGAIDAEIGPLLLGMSLGKDVAGGHGGVVGTGTVGIRFQMSSRLAGQAIAEANWASDRYMESYFTVSPEQSRNSGLPVFDAKGGIKDAGASFGLHYLLGRHWVLAGIGGYARLMNDASAAPLVKLRGSADQYYGGLFLARRF